MSENIVQPPIKNTSSTRGKLITREEVIAVIMECTEKLGRAPSRAELMKTGAVKERQIVRHFGTFTRALEACNLESNGPGNKLPIEKLFRDWAGMVRTLKKIPSRAEYQQFSNHSPAPLKTRFHHWSKIPQHMRCYAEDHGRAAEWKDVMEIIAAYEVEQKGQECTPAPEGVESKPRVLADRPLYGVPVRPYPLIFGPTNESGVIYLFGTLSAELGYVVTRIQPEFPDCEAFRMIDENHCQLVRIEFEYESRNFVRHMHDVNGADVIVCWKHNWEDCPLEVIELSKIVMGKGSIG
ncbi:MAG TPA: hypothetical protein VGJ33_07605 [Candidatus Angelobacter sp.]|jgi:hypothetical protein